jgi:hypothetical protein
MPDARQLSPDSHPAHDIARLTVRLTDEGLDPAFRGAVLTVWTVVNAVNLLQTIGFLSRIPAGDRAVNHLLGYFVIALALPTALALFLLIRCNAPLFHLVGPFVFIAFVVLMAVVDYIRPVEFRTPPRASILVPFLTLFFGSILLMGLPMYRIDRRLWLVTVFSYVLLLLSMVRAIRHGVG